MDVIIRYALYTSFFVSIGIVIFLAVQPYFMQMQNSFDRIMKKNEYQKLLQQTRYFLERSIGQNSLFAAYVYLLSLAMIFFISFSAFIIGGNHPLISIVYSLFIVLSIFSIFYALAYRNQVLVTHEGIHLLEELINNYKIYHLNIIETIERTSENLSEIQAPLSKKMMRNLSFRVKHARNDDMVREALEQLVNTIGVSWAYSLSSVFEKAIIEGIDVTEALKDIKIQLEDLEQLKESLKDEVYEAKTMIVVMYPLMFLITIGVVYLFEIPFKDYLTYQFGEGVQYLIIILLLMVASIGYYLFITKPKNDY